MTDSLTFFCPACSTKLNVPASMAGVSGPCPSCGNVIQAPALAATSKLPAFPSFDEQKKRQAQDPSGSEAARGSLRIEPRNQRHREPDAPEVVARPMPEYFAGDQQSSKLPQAPRNRRSNTPIRVFLCALVCIIIGGVFFGLKALVSGSPKGGKTNAALAKEVRILPEDPVKEPEPQSVKVTPAPETATKPSTPNILEPGPKIQPAAAALPVLEKFLNAKNLGARRPLLETKLSIEQLEASILSRPFPPDAIVSPDIQETNPADNTVDMFYNVDFREPGGALNPQLLLVRVRGGGDPKIVVDPFLDTFGGRLAAYAGAPSDAVGSFQVTVTAIAGCYDKTVPKHDEKLTLRLLPRDNAAKIADAYFSKQSKIGEMLLDDRSGFRYGQARNCRVTLRWNKEESPEKPFLEAVSLSDFRWNP